VLKSGEERVYIYNYADYLHKYKINNNFLDVIVCPLCNKKFTKYRKNNHNKTKKHLLMLEIYNKIYQNTTTKQQEDPEIIKKMVHDEYIKVKYCNTLNKLTQYISVDGFKNIVSCK